MFCMTLSHFLDLAANLQKLQELQDYTEKRPQGRHEANPEGCIFFSGHLAGEI